MCQQAFGQNGALKGRINTVHENRRPFQCEVCQKYFGQKSNLKHHLRAAHETDG